jgi:hypothetical protein
MSTWVEKTFTLEHGLIVGTLLAVLGVGLIAYQATQGWGHVDDGGQAASVAILGLLTVVLGGKLWFDAFFLTITQLKRAEPSVLLYEVDVVAEPREQLISGPEIAVTAAAEAAAR